MNNKAKEYLSYGLWFFLGLLLLVFRAWPRLLTPEIWSEDGTRNLYEWIKYGLPSLLEPVNGYLILIPKIITAASASLSFFYYPEISTILAFIFTAFVFAVLAKSPTHLRAPGVIAITCMLIPSDPEVFGLPLYTFWWSALLLFALVFWDESKGHFLFRSVILLLASLSSPVCIVTLPLLLGRAFIFRSIKCEAYLALIATACVLVQLYAMWPLVPGGKFSIYFVQQIIPVFIGSYFLGNLLPELQWVFGLAGVLLTTIAASRTNNNLALWGLIYLLGASILMSITRVDINSINQATAGPRYFFFPYIIISWILVQVAFISKDWWLRFLTCCLLMLSVTNMIPVMGRAHSSLNWREHLASCTKFENYTIPIQSNGDAAHAWRVTLSGEQCEKMLGNKINFPAYPFRAIKKNVEASTASVSGRDIVESSWVGGDSQRSEFEGMQVLGSWITSDADKGSIVLHLKKGDKFFYRSGPVNERQILETSFGEIKKFDLPTAPNWTLLDFSNKDLPDRFSVKLYDQGDAWGEWSAIAIAK